MYLQGVDNVYNLTWTTAADGRKLSYGDVYKQNEIEQSTYNFEHSDADFLFTAFTAHEKQAKHLMDVQLALPAYEQVLKCAHSFNLLDARGAISVTERAAYIGRIRNLARGVAQSYRDSRARLGYPMADSQIAAMVLCNEGIDAVTDTLRQAELSRASLWSAPTENNQVTQKVAL
jgi:glycyl-tRNA synthetase alpha chain